MPAYDIHSTALGQLGCARSGPSRVRIISIDEKSIRYSDRNDVPARQMPFKDPTAIIATPTQKAQTEAANDNSVSCVTMSLDDW